MNHQMPILIAFGSTIQTETHLKLIETRDSNVTGSYSLIVIGHKESS